MSDLLHISATLSPW